MNKHNYKSLPYMYYINFIYIFIIYLYNIYILNYI